MIGRRFETYAKLAEALTEIDETKARLFVVFFVEGRLRRGGGDTIPKRMSNLDLALESAHSKLDMPTR